MFRGRYPACGHRNDTMIQLEYFTLQDADVLRKKLYSDWTAASIRAMITQWNTKEFHGKHFEMFAVKSDGVIVGCISLAQQNGTTVSIGPEIFLPYRKCGFAAKAMCQAMEIAHERGFTAVSQQVRVNNTASIRLHEKLGFETDGQEYTTRHGNACRMYRKDLRQEPGTE